MDQPAADVLAAAPAFDVEQLAPGYREAFRQVVKDVLQSLFFVDENEASRKVSAYFFDGGEPGLFVYHRSPLQIATDLFLTFGQELDSDQERRYLEIVRGPVDHYGLPLCTLAEEREHRLAKIGGMNI